MGVCCGRYIDPPHIELANQVDKRIQKKQGLKTAEQLAQQNGRFADAPDELRRKEEARFAKKKEEGKWGQTRETLVKAQNMSSFARHLNLTQHKMHDALSQFQALDKDGNGVIDRGEFAAIFGLDPKCEKTSYMFNALDVDRNGQLNYKEFLVVAAHFNSSLDDLSKARFCFKMVDDDNDGVVTYTELRTFLVNVLYSNSSAKHRMASKVDDLITRKLKIETYDTLREQDFAELVANNRETFTPMLALYSKLHKFFSHTFDPSPAKHTNIEVSQYFHLEESGAGAPPQKATSGYSSTAASSFIRDTPNFQHDFKGNGSGKNTKSPASWDQEFGDRGHGRERPAGAWEDPFPPKLERKISQDDSLHDYYSRSSKIGGGRRYGTTIDYGHQPPSQITTDKRVGHRWGDGLDDEAPLGSSLNEEEFCKFVQTHHAPKKEKPKVRDTKVALPMGSASSKRR